jgi:hypothetical protein
MADMKILFATNGVARHVSLGALRDPEKFEDVFDKIWKNTSIQTVGILIRFLHSSGPCNDLRLTTGPIQGEFPNMYKAKAVGYWDNWAFGRNPRPPNRAQDPNVLLQRFYNGCTKFITVMRAHGRNPTYNLFSRVYGMWDTARTHALDIYAIVECGLKDQQRAITADDIVFHIFKEVTAIGQAHSDFDAITGNRKIYILWDFGYKSWGDNWKSLQFDGSINARDIFNGVMDKIQEHGWNTNGNFNNWLFENSQILLPSDRETEINQRTHFTGLPRLWPYMSLEDVNKYRNQNEL